METSNSKTRRAAKRAAKRAEESVQKNDPPTYDKFLIIFSWLIVLNYPKLTPEKIKNCSKDTDGPTHCTIFHGHFCPLDLNNDQEEELKSLFFQNGIESMGKEYFPLSIKEDDYPERKNFFWGMIIGETMEMYKKYYHGA